MLEICAVCGCKALWKAGIVKGKQRYRCKNCNKNQAETDGRVKYSGAERKYALVMYLEDCGFRRIARIMSKIFGKHYRHQTIMNWIKKDWIKGFEREVKAGKSRCFGEE